MGERPRISELWLFIGASSRVCEEILLKEGNCSLYGTGASTKVDTLNRYLFLESCLIKSRFAVHLLTAALHRSQQKSESVWHLCWKTGVQEEFLHSCTRGPKYGCVFKWGTYLGLTSQVDLVVGIRFHRGLKRVQGYTRSVEHTYVHFVHFTFNESYTFFRIRCRYGCSTHLRSSLPTGVKGAGTPEWAEMGGNAIALEKDDYPVTIHYKLRIRRCLSLQNFHLKKWCSDCSRSWVASSEFLGLATKGDLSHPQPLSRVHTEIAPLAALRTGIGDQSDPRVHLVKQRALKK